MGNNLTNQIKTGAAIANALSKAGYIVVRLAPGTVDLMRGDDGRDGLPDFLVMLPLKAAARELCEGEGFTFKLMLAVKPAHNKDNVAKAAELRCHHLMLANGYVVVVVNGVTEALEATRALLGQVREDGE